MSCKKKGNDIIHNMSAQVKCNLCNKEKRFTLLNVEYKDIGETLNIWKSLGISIDGFNKINATIYFEFCGKRDWVSANGITAEQALNEAKEKLYAHVLQETRQMVRDEVNRVFGVEDMIT